MYTYVTNVGVFTCAPYVAPQFSFFKRVVIVVATTPSLANGNFYAVPRLCKCYLVCAWHASSTSCVLFEAIVVVYPPHW